MKLFAKRATAVIMTLVMAIGLSFALAACSSASNDETLIKNELDKVLGAFKNPTAESLSAYVNDSDVADLEKYGVDYVEMFQHLFKHFDYTIDSVKVDGNNAVAKLTVTNIDIAKAANDATAAMQNDEAFTTELMNAYSSGGETAMYKLIFGKIFDALDASTDTVTSEVDLKLEKKDNKWDIDEDSMNDFISKVYGGLDMSSL